MPCSAFSASGSSSGPTRPSSDESKAGQRSPCSKSVLYVVGVASIALGWWFNIRFVNEYGPGTAFFNPLWGDGSWAHYMQLMFVNPAAGSAGQDYTIGNVILLPLMVIIDGRRRGIARPWMFFVVTLFTSFAFGWAFYLAAVERQRRLSKVAVA